MTPEQRASEILFADRDFVAKTECSEDFFLVPATCERITPTALAERIRATGSPYPRKVYIGGPMRGIPEFNFPAFHAAAVKLRAEGWYVFNPAEKDNERHGTDISKGNVTGDESIAAKEHGFNLREALALDLEFICKEADAIALLPGWEKSKGATAEKATADALGLEIIRL